MVQCASDDDSSLPDLIGRYDSDLDEEMDSDPFARYNAIEHHSITPTVSKRSLLETTYNNI